MVQQFKMVTYIHPMKESKKQFKAQVFEDLINEHLREGWTVINCESIYYGGVTPKNGIHYTAYLIKE